MCLCDLPDGTPHACGDERQMDGAISFVDAGELSAVRAETPVLVCEACLRASCFHGHAECARVFASGVVTRTVAELDALRLEHPSHYAAQLSRARIARVEEIAAE